MSDLARETCLNTLSALMKLWITDKRLFEQSDDLINIAKTLAVRVHISMPESDKGEIGRFLDQLEEITFKNKVLRVLRDIEEGGHGPIKSSHYDQVLERVKPPKLTP